VRTHHTMGYFALWGAAPNPALFLKKEGQKLLISIE